MEGWSTVGGPPSARQGDFGQNVYSTDRLRGTHLEEVPYVQTRQTKMCVLRHALADAKCSARQQAGGAPSKILRLISKAIRLESPSCRRRRRKR